MHLKTCQNTRAFIEFLHKYVASSKVFRRAFAVLVSKLVRTIYELREGMGRNTASLFSRRAASNQGDKRNRF